MQLLEYTVLSNSAFNIAADIGSISQTLKCHVCLSPQTLDQLHAATPLIFSPAL